MSARRWISSFDQTTDTRVLKLLNVIDEYSREYLALTAGRSMDAKGVVAVALYFIEPGSPWLNGKVEFFNGELFESVAEAQRLLDRWRDEYNKYRPHRSLGYLSPAEFVSLELHQQRCVLRESVRPRKWWKEVERLAS